MSLYLSMYRGDDRELLITASEDLSGSEVRFTARRTRHAEEATIEKSTADASIAIAGAQAMVTIDAADTVDEQPGALFWDIEITDPAGRIHTVASGRLALLLDVTRPVPA